MRSPTEYGEAAEGFESAGEVTVRLPELSTEADLDRARTTIKELRLEIKELEGVVAELGYDLDECMEMGEGS